MKKKRLCNPKTSMMKNLICSDMRCGSGGGDLLNVNGGSSGGGVNVNRFMCRRE